MGSAGHQLGASFGRAQPMGAAPLPPCTLLSRLRGGSGRPQPCTPRHGLWAAWKVLKQEGEREYRHLIRHGKVLGVRPRSQHQPHSCSLQLLNPARTLLQWGWPGHVVLCRAVPCHPVPSCAMPELQAPLSSQGPSAGGGEFWRNVTVQRAGGVTQRCFRSLWFFFHGFAVT